MLELSIPILNVRRDNVFPEHNMHRVSALPQHGPSYISSNEVGSRNPQLANSAVCMHKNSSGAPARFVRPPRYG